MTRPGWWCCRARPTPCPGGPKRSDRPSKPGCARCWRRPPASRPRERDGARRWGRVTPWARARHWGPGLGRRGLRGLGRRFWLPDGDDRLGNQIGGAVRGDGLSIGEKLPGVLKDNYAVAEQAPSLLGVADEGTGRLAVRTARVRARWRMRAHSRASRSFIVVVLITHYCASSTAEHGMARCDCFPHHPL